MANIFYNCILEQTDIEFSKDSYLCDNDFNLTDYYKYSLNQIMNIENGKLKIELLKLYSEYIADLQKNNFYSCFIDQNKSIEQIESELEIFLNRNTSNYFFPGNLVILYFKAKKHKSTERRICNLCGSRINPGDLYYEYRPLLYNKTTNSSYYLENSLIAKVSDRHHLPQNIFELETMQVNMNNVGSELCFPNNELDNLNLVEYDEMANIYCQFKFKILSREKISK